METRSRQLLFLFVSALLALAASWLSSRQDAAPPARQGESALEEELRELLTRRLEEALGAPVRIGQLSFSAFSREVVIERLSVPRWTPGPEQSPTRLSLSVRRITARLSLSALLSGELQLRALHLSEPRLQGFLALEETPPGRSRRVEQGPGILRAAGDGLERLGVERLEIERGQVSLRLLRSDEVLPLQLSALEYVHSAASPSEDRLCFELAPAGRLEARPGSLSLSNLDLLLLDRLLSPHSPPLRAGSLSVQWRGGLAEVEVRPLEGAASGRPVQAPRFQLRLPGQPSLQALLSLWQGIRGELEGRR